MRRFAIRQNIKENGGNIEDVDREIWEEGGKIYEDGI